MKTKLFLALALVATLAACKTDEPDEPKAPKTFLLDPNAMVRIEPAKGVQLKVKAVNAEYTHLSGLEIVKQAYDIYFYSIPLEQYTGSAFADIQRDTVSSIPALLMPGFKIIEPSDTSLVPYFIDCRDLIVRKISNLDKPNMVIDTIAYIPNDSLAVASLKIKEAFAEKDNETVYKLFNSLYKFTPVTGAEWKELKKKGLN